jgi:hypothetical protein
MKNNNYCAAILVALLVCGCRTTGSVGRLSKAPPNRYGNSITPITSTNGLSWLTFDEMLLAFNPGLDPTNLQPGDTIYRASPYEKWLYAECGGNLWIPGGHREFTADLDDDGQNERIVCRLLRMDVKDWTSARGPRGRPFLSVFSRVADGTWCRRATFVWDDNGGRIRDVRVHAEEDYVLLELHMTSHGATAMGKYGFIIIPNSLVAAGKVQFINGFLNRESSFTACGSAGYSLHFRQSENKQSIRFRKYATQPVRMLVQAEYQLEGGGGSSSYGFVLVKEERIPLDQRNSEDW